MFERILIALDGSADARHAAAHGLALADAFGSRVSALFVIDTRVVEGPAVETLAPLWGEMSARPFRAEVLQAWTDRGEQELRQFSDRAAARGREEIETHLEVGLAEETILARSAGADLLVMGRRGENVGFGRHPIGYTLARVLRHVAHPVFIAGRQDADSTDGKPAPEYTRRESGLVPRTCLVAYDGREAAVRALDLAARYVSAVGGELRIVTAGTEEADALLDPVHRLLHDHDVRWESARLDAEPADAVAEAARRWSAAALFMGAFGLSRVRDLLLGSQTEAILESVSLPVFLTR
jgi:nucleotide-binding universal stress UspA family protein